MAERIVVNTGPLIALARIEALDIVGRLPFELICPREVRDELDQGAEIGHPHIKPSWLAVVSLRERPSPLSLSALSEKPRSFNSPWSGLKVTGALGLLGRAKLLGLLPALRPLIELAVERGIRYHPELVRQVLSAVGE